MTTSSKLPFHLPALSRSSHMRIGLFGGSFNPPHEGHRHVSMEAKKRLKLDHVVWMVSPQNPLKSALKTAPLAERLAACRTLLRHDGGHHAGSIETTMKTQYTIDTLRALRRRWPNAKFVWIMGSDNLASFHRWQGWRQIAQMVPIAVLERPPLPLKTIKNRAAIALRAHRVPESKAPALASHGLPAWVLLAIRRHPASSSALRKTLGGS